MCNSKVQRLNAYATPYFPSLTDPLRLLPLLPSPYLETSPAQPPPPPPPLAQPHLHPSVNTFTPTGYHYYFPPNSNQPSVLPASTYVYNHTTTPAVAGDITSKTTAVERFEGGLAVIEAKKDKVEGCPTRVFPIDGRNSGRGFYSGRRHRRSSKFFHGSNPKPLPTQMIGCSPPSHGLDQKKFRDTTSLMVRNIPSRLRGMLINLLDKHCEEVNAKIAMRSGTALSAYDFVYLPIDFRTGFNKGYAFVNFTSKAAAGQFKSSYQGHKWHLFSTKKVCQIDDAQIQGRENLICHFQRTKFPCATDEYLPVQFTPPRNGSSQFTCPSIVGSYLDS